jgi:predicted CXXCH cytochrome family protein
MSRLAALLILAACTVPGPVWAFHDGGVASCSGCHTTHNRQDGVPVDPLSPAGNAMLLRFDNPTDVCLYCHAATIANVFGSDPMNPPPEHGAGNFTFLLEDNINDGRDGATVPISGDHAGHNVPSLLWGIPPEVDYTVSPGGTYPAGALTCISCHDPHGTQNFRMLRGLEAEGDGEFTFIYPAPQGEGIDITVEQEGTVTHTAYQQGWSAWCANCHGFYHEELASEFKHPVDELMSGTYLDTYNRYNGAADPNGGVYATAYLPEVPLEDPSMTATATFGAGPSSRMTCMTCHRAHATSAPMAGRWDSNVQYLDRDGLVSGSYPIPVPYPGLNQRPLCVKCHYNDIGNHGAGRGCMECHGSGSPGPGP